MSKKEFLSIIHKIKSLYGKRFCELDEDGMNAWYECLSDLNVSILNAALINYAKTSDYPPTVAAIRKEYETVTQELVRDMAELKRLYGMTISFYPGAEDKKDLFDIWEALHNGKPVKEKLDTARRILNHVCVFVRRCEENGINEMPTLGEFLKGVSINELSG